MVGSIIKFRDGNELAQRHYAVIVAADDISYSLVIDSVPGRVAVVPAASADTYFEAALVGVVRVSDDPVNRTCVYESDVMIEFTLRLTNARLAGVSYEEICLEAQQLSNDGTNNGAPIMFVDHVWFACSSRNVDESVAEP